MGRERGIFRKHTISGLYNRGLLSPKKTTRASPTMGEAVPQGQSPSLPASLGGQETKRHCERYSPETKDYRHGSSLMMVPIISALAEQLVTAACAQVTTYWRRSP
jgi:hypothetical protein